MKFLHLALLAIALIPVLHAEDQSRIVLLTAPPNDGQISSTGAVDDGPDIVKDLELVAHVGVYYDKFFVGILEFPLPPSEGRKLRSASLELCVNGKGPFPSAITVETYGYTGETADGVVDQNDWTQGELLGLCVAKGDEINIKNQLPPVNVTEFVQKALDEKKRFVGFRLYPKEMDGLGKAEGIILRTSEFAQQFPAYAPKLVLDFE
jgi:hypothetical protein